MKLREKNVEMITLTIEIPKDLKEQMDTLIASYGELTPSEIVVNALEEYFLMGDLSH